MRRAVPHRRNALMESRSPPPLEIEERPYGWVMVSVTFLLSVLAFGGLPSVAVFIKPLSVEFGWTRGEASLGYTMIAVSAAIAGLAFGVIADRFGTRWIALVGAVGMGSSYLLQSGQTTLAEYYLTAVVFGGTGLAVISGPMLVRRDRQSCVDLGVDCPVRPGVQRCHGIDHYQYARIHSAPDRRARDGHDWVVWLVWNGFWRLPGRRRLRLDRQLPLGVYAGSRCWPDQLGHPLGFH